MKLQGSIVISFALIISAVSTQGQFQYQFENISTDQGLSNGWVRSALQDSQGYLWFGTNLGLNRFDGYQFKVFQTSSALDGHLSNAAIWCLHEDEDGKIWIGTDGGLNVFDPKTERFQSYESQADSLGISKRIRGIAQDEQGNLWLATHAFLERSGSLVFFDKAKKKLIKLDEGGLTNYAEEIVFDSYGNLWLGTGEGILIFDPNTKKLIKHVQKDAKARIGLPSNAISTIVRGKDNIIWVGTWNAGVSKITYNKNLDLTFQNFRAQSNEKSGRGLVSDGVRSVTKDSKGNLWITTGEGVSVLNASTSEILNLTSNLSDPNSLKESNTWIVLEDRTGIIWVGHDLVGISKVKNNKGFITFNQSNQSTSLSGGNISAIVADSIGNLWVGATDRGLYKIDFHDNYTAPPEIRSFPFKPRINGILIKPNDNVWISAFGYYQLNSRTGKFKPITKVKDFRGLFRDSDRNFWVGGNVNLYKVKRLEDLTDGLRPILPDSRLKSLQHDVNFSGLIEDQKKRLWITNWQGEIFLYDLIGEKAYMPNITASVKIDFSKARISTLHLDEKGYLWVGTLEGLLKYKIIENDQPENVAVHLEKVYRQKEGLTTVDGNESLNIHSIQSDSRGNIWIAHTGLSMLNPATDSIKTYYIEDGLPANQFGGKIRFKNGFLAYGSNNGVVLFHPDSLRDNTTPPAIVITDFKILNRSVSFSEDGAKSTDTFLRQSLANSNEVTISYDQNVLGFEFSALDFTAPQRNQYAYQMEGFDKDWIYVGNKRSTTYTNLDPGTYTFRVKGSNNDGVWNEVGTAIRITILPPYWATWWAYVLYVCLTIFLAFYFWRRLTTRARLQTLALIKSAEADKLRELDSLKSRFFANISHEFRTPLTLILGPLEKRLLSATDPSDQQELSVMHRNASRLLILINQLLDFSRLEAGTLKLKCHQGDLRLSIRSVASQFSSMADSKKINFKEETNESVVLFFDADKIEKVLSNLLSNAFKFTSPGGTISLSVRQHPPGPGSKEGYAEIIVSDTGIGIPPEHLPKIFDRFYQVDMSNTRAYEGSGIGLSLTKELVELHHGSIAVSSESGIGSVFTVRLPLGSSHLKPEEIIDGATETLTHELRSPVDEIAVMSNDDVATEESILIIEDNDDLRAYVRSEFRKSHKIFEATDGEAGIEIAIREVPTLIISDLMMPKKDGLAVCQEIKQDERTSHIPIILLTARADIDSKLKGYQKGADDYMAKPFTLVELRTRIENLISIRRKLQEKFAQPITVLPSEIADDSADSRFLKRAVEIIEAHLSDSNFGVEPLAGEMNVSQTQLYRKLHAVTGSGPNEFIRHIRLNHAANLLRNKSGNVSEVAYRAGFNNLSYFAKVFKEKFGVTPLEFLKNPPDVYILNKSVK